MGIPLGDWLRSIINPNSWLGRILGLTKGLSVTVGRTQIDLDQKPGALPAGGAPLDSTPHAPGPSGPPFGGR